MIKCKIRNNVTGETYTIEKEKTLRDALEIANVDFSRGMVMLDGTAINAGDLNRSFLELGYDGTDKRDRCLLTVVAKVDNAQI